MNEINVYQQYFSGDCVFSGRPRHAVQVLLTAESGEGNIRYSARVSFFPHDDPEDFAVSYDAEASQILFEGRDRRSRKREKAFLDDIRTIADSLAQSLNGTIYWDKPLIEPRFA